MDPSTSEFDDDDVAPGASVDLSTSKKVECAPVDAKRRLLKRKIDSLNTRTLNRLCKAVFVKLYHPAVPGASFDDSWQPRDKEATLKFISVFFNTVHTTPFAKGAKKIMTSDIYSSVVDPDSGEALKMRADISNLVAKIMEIAADLRKEEPDRFANAVFERHVSGASPSWGKSVRGAGICVDSVGFEILKLAVERVKMHIMGSSGSGGCGSADAVGVDDESN